MGDYYGYDSLAGPTLMLRPDELDKLDTSHYESPTVHNLLEEGRRLEASIHGTLNGMKGGLFEEKILGNNKYNNLETPPARLPNIRITNQGPAAALITPPSTSTNTLQKNPQSGGVFLQNQQPTPLLSPSNQNYYNRAMDDIEQRLGMEKLQKDIEELLKQHKNVIRIKDEVERSLNNEIARAKSDLMKERNIRERDREKYIRHVRELKEKIRSLENKLDDNRERRRNKWMVDSDEEEEVNLNLGYSLMSRNEYEKRLGQMQKDYDSKISNLVKQFEKEKTAALEILKSRMKAEISLLIPRMKEQFQKALLSKLQNQKQSMVEKFQKHYEEKLQSYHSQQQAEKKNWQRQMKDQLERERVEIGRKLKAKYELQLMEMKNECEKRLLQKHSGGNRRQIKPDDSFAFGNDTLPLDFSFERDSFHLDL